MRSSNIWRKAPLIAEVADESGERAAVLHLDAEQPVVLEGTAVHIWQAIDGRASEGEIIKHLADYYAESTSAITSQVVSFIDSLADQRLIEPAAEAV